MDSASFQNLLSETFDPIRVEAEARGFHLAWGSEWIVETIEVRVAVECYGPKGRGEDPHKYIVLKYDKLQDFDVEDARWAARQLLRETSWNWENEQWLRKVVSDAAATER
jgi:hypothetical protein